MSQQGLHVQEEEEGQWVWVPKKVPNLSNATPGFLVDELGKIREPLKQLKKWEKFYQQAILGRRSDGQNAISGDMYDALVSDQSQARIDSDKVREYLKDDPSGLEQVTNKIEFKVIRTTKKTMAGA